MRVHLSLSMPLIMRVQLSLSMTLCMCNSQSRCHSACATLALDVTRTIDVAPDVNLDVALCRAFVFNSGPDPGPPKLQYTVAPDPRYRRTVGSRWISKSGWGTSLPLSVQGNTVRLLQKNTFVGLESTCVRFCNIDSQRHASKLENIMAGYVAS